ncbi:MAG: holo-ACP synthase, partial [Aedoeadaptatus pacaensis]
MIGIDMVYIPRVQNILDRRGEAFLERVFSREERRSLRMNAAHIAGRFAAKEAMAKALGDGVFKAGFKNLIVET